MRWHPLLEQWIITATHRQRRTYHPPRGACPLCASGKGRGFTEVPRADYDVVVFENRFPALQQRAPRSAVRGTPLTPVQPARGICEVILYSPEHEQTFAGLPVEQIYKLACVWADRYQELGARKFVRYVLIFENKGAVVGVTLTHPHGQIYAFPFVPSLIQRELEASRRYFSREKKCLKCTLAARERRDSQRMIFESKFFEAFVPFYARWPYEVHVQPRRHVQDLTQLTEGERWSLARMLKSVTQTYDALFGFSLPYMMLLHQQPTDGRRHTHFHFHIEFLPPNRTADKLKYLAGTETGAGSFSNDTLPEQSAAALRRAARRAKS
ncbi:MAG TPA: galactose-1-phosphate uridylyltransferase [Candidatus Acidoferrales bacterium]|nr:galactose-1-phosphate uridylyltransferase [Candidatus Acidoferrales bacterium]